MISSVSTTPVEAVDGHSDSVIVKVGGFLLSFDAGQVAQDILLNGDDDLQRMTNLDRGVRMRSRRTDISNEEFRTYMFDHVIA
jgi:hypothetical protein